MSEDQGFFLYALLLLNGLFVVFHALRSRITLGTFFGAAGVFSLMLWQVLQTGWWVDWGSLHFNAGLTTFIPILLWGTLLTLVLDGLKTTRAFILMILMTGVAAWAYALFRQHLARYVPLPYTIELSSREHIAIVASLALTQYGSVLLLNLSRTRLGWLALPCLLPLAAEVWLGLYSLLRYDAAMAWNNLRNESLEYFLASLPAALLSLPYLFLAARAQQLMPPLPCRALFRPTPAQDGDDELINRQRTISELQQLNQQLQENSRLMDYHLEHASYGIILTDAQGLVTRLNVPATALLGPLPAGQRLEERLAALFTPTQDGPTTLARLAEEDRPRRWKRSDDDAAQPQWAEIQVTPLRNRPQQPAKGYYVLLQDVTQAVLAEQRRLNSARIKDIHTTGQVLAHDFSNVFIGARAQLERLRQQDIPGQQEAMEGLDTALKHAQSMLSQLGSGQQFGAPKLQPVALAGLIGDARSICQAAAEQARITLRCEPLPTLIVEVDPSQIVRVLTNLIRNALRASPAESSLVIGAEPRDQGVLITITDQGCGIPAEKLQSVFEPGYTSKTEGQGGLGLSISYLMVDAHGGHLELVQNPNGSGIQARIWLPLPHSAPQLDSIPDASRILLLRPDETSHATLLERLEEDKHCIVADLRSGEEMAALLQDDPHWDYLLAAPESTDLPPLPAGIIRLNL